MTGHREYVEYSPEGLRALGEAVAHWRDVPKPHWQPQVTDGMDDFEIELERRDKWSLTKMAAIINREFNLSGNLTVNKDTIHRLENPPAKAAIPPVRLIELIASLEIMLNPKTKEPFSDADLRLIAKGLLDWRTGEELNPCQASQG